LIGIREDDVHVVLDQQHGHGGGQCLDRREDLVPLGSGTPAAGSSSSGTRGLQAHANDFERALPP
jgi:hypothetical protein